MLFDTSTKWLEQPSETGTKDPKIQKIRLVENESLGSFESRMCTAIIGVLLSFKHGLSPAG